MKRALLIALPFCLILVGSGLWFFRFEVLRFGFPELAKAHHTAKLKREGTQTTARENVDKYLAAREFWINVPILSAPFIHDASGEFETDFFSGKFTIPTRRILEKYRNFDYVQMENFSTSKKQDDLMFVGAGFIGNYSQFSEHLDTHLKPYLTKKPDEQTLQDLLHFASIFLRSDDVYMALPGFHIFDRILKNFDLATLSPKLQHLLCGPSALAECKQQWTDPHEFFLTHSKILNPWLPDDVLAKLSKKASPLDCMAINRGFRRAILGKRAVEVRYRKFRDYFDEFRKAQDCKQNRMTDIYENKTVEMVPMRRSDAQELHRRPFYSVMRFIFRVEMAEFSIAFFS